MHHLAELLEAAIDHTSFLVGDRRLSASQFRDLRARRSRSDKDVAEARRAQVSVCGDHLSGLAGCIREVLDEYIDPSTDQIGHAFPIPGSGGSSSVTVRNDAPIVREFVSPVENFATALAGGAALLGAQRVASLVFAWDQGAPITYQTKSLLNGDDILSAPLSPLAGIRVESLALSTDQLTGYLPLPPGRSLHDYLGQMLLTIDHSAEPALFHPNQDQSVAVARATELPGLASDIVCQALALEADAFAEVAYSWNDFGELSALCLVEKQGTWSTGQAHFRVPGKVRITLTTDFVRGATTLTLHDARELQIDRERLRAALTGLAEPSAKNLRTATSRWVRSKDTGPTLADRFIDLRIALESLYLQDFPREQSQEMSFRLAVFGAWHLGANLEERKRIRKTLRDTYREASKAVHTGSLDPVAEKEELLSEAQALVRQGLLKLLTSGAPPEWGDLILGA